MRINTCLLFVGKTRAWLSMKKCRKPLMADVYRDGGSYGFVYKADKGKIYELHLPVVRESPCDCKRYYEPLVFQDNCNSGNVVEHPTWEEAKDFVSRIKFDDDRFSELKWIIENGGCTEKYLTRLC
ncbi:hypothetical protein A9Q99_14535 [Gammaproteobacteria bacterium 45_16_T64]|nr:hypothetical protein A9Q99_14535 [Gammaproteobacteria bacterium 45_16_T64]